MLTPESLEDGDPESVPRGAKSTLPVDTVIAAVVAAYLVTESLLVTFMASSAALAALIVVRTRG